MTALSKDILRVDMTNDPDRLESEHASASFKPVERTEKTTDLAAPRPRPKLPAYVHPH
ncbi:MAG: hypothetical protein AAF557_05125 [Pseudomonadota bacterium]